MYFKILILISSMISLTSCTTTFIKSPLTINNKINNNQTLTLKSLSNKNIGTLNTNDNWNTANFITPNKKIYPLTRAVSADGIKLNNGSLVIHFKGSEGILEKNSVTTHFTLN
ncbi:hypothetical protein [Candidatus Cetobacterium colombiensis]|uniref:Uncharacterized protein n=1 Tax=Candidatus Cetobacterium colombiensis TaxID=3073100 RepID=A0ABU4W998_9FUSO|nr:hypothetical protein [Candidatus Cetobacterium colombiensis]MDX8336104.1 hypothetical protein [Candidatus Cetobacterium colombiensis]